MNLFLITRAIEEEYHPFVGKVLESKEMCIWDGLHYCNQVFVTLDTKKAILWEDVEGFFLADLKGEELELYKMLYPMNNWQSR